MKYTEILDEIDKLQKKCEELRQSILGINILASNAFMESDVDYPQAVSISSSSWREMCSDFETIFALNPNKAYHDRFNQIRESATSVDDDVISDVSVLLNDMRNTIKIEMNRTGEITMNSSNIARPRKLFISHASKDADYIEIIVSLLETLGLHDDEIICSSIPPYCIPLGKKVYDWLVNEFQNSDLHILFALSKNYYSRPACLNEMGAAWAMKHDWTGVLLPGFNFSDIEGCIDATQISIKLDDSDRQTLNYRLEELKNNLTDIFKLRTMSPTVWERKRDEFLCRIHEVADKHAKENSDAEERTEYHQPVAGVKNVEYIPVEPAFLLVYAASKDGVILKLDANGMPPVITVHGKLNFMSNLSHRESARWQEALDMLINWGWVKPQGNEGVVYELTGTGYEKADMLRDGMKINIDNDPLDEMKNFTT